MPSLFVRLLKRLFPFPTLLLCGRCPVMPSTLVQSIMYSVTGIFVKRRCTPTRHIAVPTHSQPAEIASASAKKKPNFVI